jgi:hypothetical protein
MTTIINTPPSGESSDSVLGVVIGVIAILILIAIFFVYILPAMNTNAAPKTNSIDVNVKLPANGTTPPATTPSPAPSTY